MSPTYLAWVWIVSPPDVSHCASTISKAGGSSVGGISSLAFAFTAPAIRVLPLCEHTLSWRQNHGFLPYARVRLAPRLYCVRIRAHARMPRYPISSKEQQRKLQEDKERKTRLMLLLEAEERSGNPGWRWWRNGSCAAAEERKRDQLRLQTMHDEASKRKIRLEEAHRRVVEEREREERKLRLEGGFLSNSS